MGASSMAAALAARDVGMASSAQHAEDVQPGWGEMALCCCIAVVETEMADGEAFTVEDLRTITRDIGLPETPELRAWGAVTVRLIREGIIEKTGQYAPAVSSNGSPKPLYRRRGNV